MKIIQIPLLPLMLLADPFHTENQIDTISASVVKIFTVSVEPDYSLPLIETSKN